MDIGNDSLALFNVVVDNLDFLGQIQSSVGQSVGLAPFAPQDIALTGNGLCGSMCASFSNLSLEYYNVTAVINTHQPQVPIEFTAFSCGQAFSSDQFYEEMKTMNYTDERVPPLKVVGIYGVAVSASLSPRLAPVHCRSYPAQNTYASR